MGESMSDAAAGLVDRIAALEAKDEIRELTARYCHGIVDGDHEAVVALFCSDGVFRTRSRAVEGHEALRAFYSAAAPGPTYKPFIQNHVVELAGDGEASGRCSVEIRIVQEAKPYTAAGHYLDRYRKEGGRWRFAERFFNAYHFAPLGEGWTK